MGQSKVSQEFDSGPCFPYSEDIERLMIEVVALIVDTGVPPVSSRNIHFERAATYLARMGEQGLSEHLQGDELTELRYDLKLLGLLSR
ncbi:hypothetical protein D3C71_1762090 [compost metagenome]